MESAGKVLPESVLIDKYPVGTEDEARLRTGQCRAPVARQWSSWTTVGTAIWGCRRPHQ